MGRYLEFEDVEVWMCDDSLRDSVGREGVESYRLECPYS